ncbi:MAG: SPOR domain-containing protein [Parasphingorhabdus sp.]|uniref:SPOR domain-containing protein n=1 Tax=Parasphingorhabdus sp. TaxID=2709688 RepID=UPI0032970AE9
MNKFKSARTLLLASAIIGWTTPALADVKDGVDAWGRGDYKTAIQEWRGPANAGDADAQFNMGQAYKLGRGVPMDLTKAEQYYKRAADQGHLQANDNYGLILFQSQRRKEALPFLQESANRGEPRAQYVLGTGHFNGDFVEKDWIKAYALMTRASAAGLPQATSNMAQMDKYIPLDQRRRAIELAGQMEENEKRVRTAQVGGLRATPSSSTIQTAQLPASQASIPTPAPVPAPIPAPVSASVAPSMPKAPAPVVAANPAPRPAPLPAATSGNWRVQLGAFSNQNKAKALWNNLENRVTGLNGLQPYLVAAGSITRLQAGPFTTKAQASKMCSNVKASGADCIVKAR